MPTSLFQAVGRRTNLDQYIAANPTYWRGIPALKAIEVQKASDAQAAVKAIQAGEADILWFAPVKLQPVVAATRGLHFNAGDSAEVESLASGDAEAAVAALAALVRGPAPAADDPALEAARPALLRLGAEYLLHHRSDTRALDPVAHFHLANGAVVDALNWQANPSAAGWERGLGMMVNYRYRLRQIERNHDRYLDEGEITASDAVRRLVSNEQS